MEHILLSLLIGVIAYIVCTLFVDHRISVLVGIVVGLLAYYGRF